MKKSTIINKLVKHQDKIISDLELALKEYKLASDADEGAVTDPEDSSQQQAALDMVMHYRLLLNSARNERDFLERVPETALIKADKGAIVETKQNIFFIGVSAPPLPFDEKRVLIGVSPQSKIAQVLKNKKIGQSFQFGKTTLTITDIY